ncbi:uncharacterized protein LOC117579823 [Drosophila guanche]|uniref:C2H2-type domain-containing protein n=1 Tax=Drosophila guanche TaxID=7266 RepID=A0A3B0JBA3_DROGU|nr:uncharacterized protein LOC117579823 [Drosophila guanche]XP_034121807.1 uncharacterized protein LOC117579823 [Drosophila guanche]SPP77302.1 Hypothetical predicted protein [Drosophila guanche]
MEIFGQKVTKAARKMKRSEQQPPHTQSHDHDYEHDLDYEHADSRSSTSNIMDAFYDDSQTLLHQVGVESDVENSRKAVERKLIYLSEANHKATPSRAVRRQAQGGHTGKGRGDGKHPKKHLAQEAAGGDKIRIRALDSARRNGLSLSDDTEESDMESVSLRLQDVVLEAEQAERSMSGVYGRKQMSTKPADAYTCNVCGAKFRIKSLLGAHRRTHGEDFAVRFRTHRACSNTTLTNGHVCKYCDRKFDLERTLHIHQLCHCKKIPPQLRRKLPYTELLHEKKAPLHDQ